jgi:putative transposase
MWQPRGQPRCIAAAGTDKRVSIFGALDYGSGRLTTLIAQRASAHEFLAFLEQLATHWPTEHLVLVMDNVAYHKTAAVRHWLAAQADRITVLWLPTYSPHLNLIERVWRFVKAKFAGHHFWNDLTGLIHHANDVLHTVRATFAAPRFPHLTLGQDLCRSA